jgi:hypothetical protein
MWKRLSIGETHAINPHSDLQQMRWSFISQGRTENQNLPILRLYSSLAEGQESSFSENC